MLILRWWIICIIRKLFFLDSKLNRYLLTEISREIKGDTCVIQLIIDLSDKLQSDELLFINQLLNLYTRWVDFTPTLLLLLLSCFSRVRLCTTPRWQPTRLHCPWDSPGKNTGVGCHFLLQCMKVKNESEVAQSCLTLSDPKDRSPPGSSVHGIFQARVLEWGAIAFSTLLH